MTIEIDRYDYDADQRVLDQENEAKNAPKRSHTKKTSDQTGLLWTLSALALAACGGGGGGGGPVVTGPANTPSGANIPDSNQGNLLSLSGAPIGRISSDGAFSTDTNSDENGEFSLASPVIADALAQDGFLAARVGGLVDTAHGRQIKDGGVDAKGNYVGPVWLTMPGETTISPLTNRIAEAYREEISRLAEGETLDIKQFYDVQLRSIFGEDARYITQADLFNADNYKILNLDEFTLIEDVRAKASSFEGTDTMDGNGGNDMLYGGDGADTMDGNGGDTITGGDNDDTIDGGDNDDTITGGAGGDTIDGGAGSDTASYAGSDTAVSIELLTNTASGGHAEGDILTNIENLIGSDHNDNLEGDVNSNVIDGGAGADTLTGNGGADEFVLAGGDRVTDFADGDDMLNVGDVTHVRLQQNGNNLLLLDANANNAVIATLEGVSNSSVITADDFITVVDVI